MKKAITYLSLVLLSFPGFVRGQEDSVQSIKSDLAHARQDTAYIDKMLLLSDLLLDRDMNDGIEYAVKALEQSRLLGYRPGEVNAYISLGDFARERSEFDSAQSSISRAIELMSGPGMHSLKLDAYISLGLVHQKIGNHELALEYFNKAIDTPQHSVDSLIMARAWLYAAETRSNFGENEDARKLSLKAYHIFRRHRIDQYASLSLNIMGDVLAKMGQNAQALEHFFEGLDIARNIGNKRIQVKHFNRIGAIYALEGKLEQSLESFFNALRMSEELNSKYDYAGILNNVAYIHVLKGDLDGALTYYKEAFQYNTAYNLTCLVPFAMEGMARVYENQLKLDSAIRYYNRALDYVKTCQMHQNEITIMQGLGRVHKAKGDMVRSIREFKKAMDLAKKSDFRRPMMEVAFELYQIYRASGDYKTALEYHELYKTQQDSILNKRSIEEITKLTDQFEFDKERAELRADKERESLILQEEIKRQELTRGYLVTGFALTLIAIIALARSYYNKQKVNQALIKLNEEKNTLIGVVAHDLRSPLNNMVSILPLIKEQLKEINEQTLDLFDLMSQSTDRMKDMIRRVLDINAIEADKVHLRLQVCDLAQILDHVAESYKMLAEPKDITIERELEHDKYHVQVDKNYLIQVFENLISNAIKFSPKGKKVRLRVYQNDEGVKASIADEGPGLTESDQKMLFSRYERLSAQPTGGESSTGLGLSIAKKYIEAMKGMIYFDTTMGEGTTFTVQFKALKVSS